MTDPSRVRLDQWLDQEDQRVSETIRRHGCAIEYVLACACDDSTPFAYTIGAFGLGHPELLVFGLSQSAAHGVLNRVFALVRDGRDLVPGEVLELDESPERWLVEQVPNPGAIVFGANRHYDRPAEVSVPVLQLTWTADQHFPWDEGYRLADTVQPLPGTFDARQTCGCRCSCDGCSTAH